MGSNQIHLMALNDMIIWSEIDNAKRYGMLLDQINTLEKRMDHLHYRLEKDGSRLKGAENDINVLYKKYPIF